MPRRKDISSDLREAMVAAHQSVKGFKTIPKVENIQTVVSLPRREHPRTGSQPLQASGSTLNVKVPDSTIRKRLNK